MAAADDRREFLKPLVLAGVVALLAVLVGLLSGPAGVGPGEQSAEAVPPSDDCPLTAEDFDGIADDDGCPDTDASVSVVKDEQFEVDVGILFLNARQIASDHNVLRVGIYVERAISANCHAGKACEPDIIQRHDPFQIDTFSPLDLKRDLRQLDIRMVNAYRTDMRGDPTVRVAEPLACDRLQNTSLLIVIAKIDAESGMAMFQLIRS